MVPSAFPLPWERVLWHTRRFAITDFRLVTLRRGRVGAEVALHDIQHIGVQQTRLERALGLGRIAVRSSRASAPAIELPRIRRAPQVALRLNLLVADSRGLPPDESVSSLPLPDVWRLPPAVRLQATLVAPSLILLTLLLIVIGLSGHQVPVAFGPDDPVRPNGVQRNQQEIAAFMEAEVMPWARSALAPVAGAERVTCETCHGRRPELRGWRMPAVTALPEPAVTGIATSAGSDSQMRNALHGYAAQGDNQAVAAYMRGVIVPGMAALLRRPAYDFAQTYEYNRARAALGCYHCHMVGS